MSTITTIPTKALKADDTLLVGASIVSVSNIEPSEWDHDRYIVEFACHSGNFDQWDGVQQLYGADAEWQVLDFHREHTDLSPAERYLNDVESDAA